MKKIFKTALCFLAASSVFISSSFALKANADDETSNILNTRCTACHGIKKITKANHDKEGWEKTIVRMMSKKKFGKNLNKEQVEKLAEYLVNSK
jgi:cytochrome c5